MPRASLPSISCHERMKIKSETLSEFDALYASLMASHDDKAPAKVVAREKNLSELVQDIAVQRRSTQASTREMTSEDDELQNMYKSMERGARKANVRREEAKKETTSSSPYASALEDRETLSRFLRDEQRARALAESRAHAAEAALLARETEMELAIEDARLETSAARTRCRQLRSDVPERWLGVFASYDAEIERLGRQNTALQEDLHRALVAMMTLKDDEAAALTRRQPPTSSDDNDDVIHLRRALRAVTLERDAIAAKLSDVDRRERQMQLIRRHAEGTAARLARVERLLVDEQRAAASARAAAATATAHITTLTREHEVQITQAQALIERLAEQTNRPARRFASRA